jgi:hypothetical protein
LVVDTAAATLPHSVVNQNRNLLFFTRGANTTRLLSAQVLAALIAHLRAEAHERRDVVIGCAVGEVRLGPDLFAAAPIGSSKKHLIRLSLSVGEV